MAGAAGLRLVAPAKINVFLRILGRRPDGYHSLVSGMQKVGLYDELVLERTGAGIELRCPDGNSPEGPENLVMRAATLFLEHLAEHRPGQGFGVRMLLNKGIPVAAGLGGGSSDAAAALVGLNTLSGANLDAQTLAGLGLCLGADVPFFLQSAPAALAEGIGERLSPLSPLSGCAIVLVNPGFAVSTRWVYRNFDLTAIERKDTFQNFRNGLNGVACVNDLEQVTAGRYPVIGEIKEAMRRHGAEAALMSGSGPTVFGLFADRARAETALRFFQRTFDRSFLVAPLQA